MRFRVAILFLLLPSLLLLPSFTAHASATPPVVLTTKTWGGSVDDFSYSIALDPAGYIYVTGRTASFGAGGDDVFLLKYDLAGKLLWQRTWGGSNGTDAGASVALDSSGNVYVAGYTNSFGYGGIDVLLLKYDSAGVFQFAKTWGGTGDEYGQGIAIDSSNNIYVAGYSTSTSIFSTTDVILLKYNQAGVLQKTVAFDSLANQEGFGVAVDSNGKIYVTGWSERCCFGSKDSLLFQFNSTLDLQWQHYYGTADAETGSAVVTDSSGGIYVVGYNSSTFFLLKYNNAGSLQWQKTGCGPCAGIGLALAVDATGTINVVFTNIIASITFTNFWNLTSSGTPLYGHSVYKTAGKPFNGRGIAADSSGNLYLAGSVYSAPPYFLGPPTETPTPGSGSDMAGSVGLTVNPSLFVSSPTGTQTTPNGSQNYGGQWDTFLLKYGPEPTVTFQTSPSTGGSINFNSTSYTNGQTGNYLYGNATATATAPAGYTFNSWSATGGLSLVSSSSNPTTVTITGSGTLTANYTHLGGTPITPAAVTLASLLTLAAPIMIKRRKK